MRTWLTGTTPVRFETPHKHLTLFPRALDRIPFLVPRNSIYTTKRDASLDLLRWIIKKERKKEREHLPRPLPRITFYWIFQWIYRSLYKWIAFNPSSSRLYRIKMRSRRIQRHIIFDGGVWTCISVGHRGKIFREKFEHWKEHFCSIKLGIRKSVDLKIFYLEYSGEKLKSLEFLSLLEMLRARRGKRDFQKIDGKYFIWSIVGRN